MRGEVDDYDRALLNITAKVAAGADPSILSVWIDTAFTGELVLPCETIDRMGLAQSSSLIADLADGTQAVLDTYSCVIEWFGVERVVEVVESDARLPLLGVGLLRDHCLMIDYRNGRVTLD